MFISSERARCFAMQMAECRFRPPKTSEEEDVRVDGKLVRHRTDNF